MDNERFRDLEESTRWLRSSHDSHEERLTELEREERRTRHRLHQLESDRQAISMAVQSVATLAARVGNAHDSLEQIAEAAAAKAIEKDRHRRGENRWKLALRVSAVLGGTGGIGYLIAYLIDLATRH